MNARFKDWTDECQIRVWADKLRLEIGLVEDGESLELLLVLVRLVPHDEQRVSQPTPNTDGVQFLDCVKDHGLCCGLLLGPSPQLPGTGGPHAPDHSVVGRAHPTL